MEIRRYVKDSSVQKRYKDDLIQLRIKAKRENIEMIENILIGSLEAKKLTIDSKSEILNCKGEDVKRQFITLKKTEE